MLLWIDLETTGLDAHDDYIMELAWQLTDHRINGVDNLYNHILELPQQGWADLQQNPIVLEMHEKSGLLHELELCTNNEGYGLLRIEDAEDRIIGAIDWLNITEPIMVAGFSVHFDLAFIRVHMPRLAERLSHRVFDVTTLKTFFSNFDVRTMYENDNKHRAYFDTLEAQHVAKEYLEFVNTHITEENNA